MQRIFEFWGSRPIAWLAIASGGLVSLLLAYTLFVAHPDESSTQVAVETPVPTPAVITIGADAVTGPASDQALTFSTTPTVTPVPLTATQQPSEAPSASSPSRPIDVVEPTATFSPTSTLNPTPTPTSLPVVHVGEEVRMDQLLIKILGVGRTDTLLWHDQELKSEGQWIIACGEAYNPTTEALYLYPEDFVVSLSSRPGYILANDVASGAAGLWAGIESITTHPSFGMEIMSGQSAPIIVAFDVPDVPGPATLWVVDARTGIDLGALEQVTLLQTPAPTSPSVANSTPAPEPPDLASDTPPQAEAQAASPGGRYYFYSPNDFGHRYGYYRPYFRVPSYGYYRGYSPMMPRRWHGGGGW